VAHPIARQLAFAGSVILCFFELCTVQLARFWSLPQVKELNTGTVPYWWLWARTRPGCWAGRTVPVQHNTCTVQGTAARVRAAGEGGGGASHTNAGAKAGLETLTRGAAPGSAAALVGPSVTLTPVRPATGWRIVTRGTLLPALAAVARIVSATAGILLLTRMKAASECAPFSLQRVLVQLVLQLVGRRRVGMLDNEPQVAPSLGQGMPGGTRIGRCSPRMLLPYSTTTSRCSAPAAADGRRAASRPATRAVSRLSRRQVGPLGYRLPHDHVTATSVASACGAAGASSLLAGRR
jgi:hypothetical protein